MSAKAKRLLCGLSIGLIACGATALLTAGAAGLNFKAQPSLIAQKPTNARIASSKRNLSLQPQASKLARQIGTRFLAGKDTTSILVGTLTIGSEARIMQMTRRQSSDGESVEVGIANSPVQLTWNAMQGGLASGRQATASERETIERLVFDSPDQFVLMQLRGASYYTVARAVRPAGAPDGYEGPVWTMVRVDDPEEDEAKKPASRWRIYYLNIATGLIDRIESEVEGRRIVAEISSWIEQDGEKVPAQIVWTRDGQTLMQFNLTNFSQSQN